MKLLITTLFLLCIFKSAFANLDNISVNSKSVPYIIELIIDHLKKVPSEEYASEEIITRLNELNENLSYLDHVNRTFFITSETYKFLLNYHFNSISFDNKISPALIKDIQEKYQLNQKVYTSFAKFIIDSTINDFEPHLQNGLLEKYSSKKLYQARNREGVRDFKLKLKYLGSWLNAMVNLGPSKFNEFLTQLIQQLLDSLASQSQIFKLHRPIQAQKYPNLFEGTLLIAPAAEKSNTSEKDETTSPADNKEKAIKAVKEIKTPDTDNASEEIDKLIEKIPE